MKRVIAISGSVRAVSSTTALLRAVAHVARDHDVRVTFYEGIRELPWFDPDVEGDDAADSVKQMRATLRECDAVLFSTPEYAHGVPGVLKNALDWLVGSGELYGKPVAVLNASNRAKLAHESLIESLTVMGATIVVDAAMTVPLAGKALDEGALASDPDVAPVLDRVVLALRG
ncbi:NADPH-dependent FMN reductase [Sandaracinus amylolyticus]|uniref:NADPH-dependent FMN reductase n=1 Tax=Sandaracinus amylolyticus TaxID=927083 RepID=UPI001F2DEC0E|nr:NADPH-dependent FMN reductase [Sandaracinus amylolyticus]UJR85466.1 Hypothetical protein I5071_75460 [Sandaracinus amylolyticus]